MYFVVNSKCVFVYLSYRTVASCVYDSVIEHRSLINKRETNGILALINTCISHFLTRYSITVLQV